MANAIIIELLFSVHAYAPGVGKCELVMFSHPSLHIGYIRSEPVISSLNTCSSVMRNYLAKGYSAFTYGTPSLWALVRAIVTSLSEDDVPVLNGF